MAGLLVHSKRSKALDEPELFGTYIELAAEARKVVNAHVDTLLAQLARIISDGVAQGEFEATDSAATARAVFDATSCDAVSVRVVSDRRRSLAAQATKLLVEFDR